MSRPRPLAGIVLAVFATLTIVLGGGCAKAKSVLRPGVEPETSVFVQFDPLVGNHDVNHLVHLYWSGTDPDGDVVRFDFRFVYPGFDPDTVEWRHTVNSDSIFAVYTPTGYATPTFEVRAVDNDGLVDSSPAFQVFAFTNQAPTLTLTPRALTDTTFAAVTLSWTAFDPDGDNGKMRFRVWLNGTANAANPIVTDQKTFTVPTSAFLEGGHLLSGPRTAFVQAIDDGGLLGPLRSTTWYVRAPVEGGDHGRLLLIDEVTGFFAGGETYDSLYANTAQRNLNPTNAPNPPYSILRLFTTQPFKTAKDLEQTFELFDAVIWYRGPQGQNTYSTVLQSTQDGLAAYLDGGGRFMLESLNAIEGRNAPGALSPSWVTTYLQCDSLHFGPIPNNADSTNKLGINSGRFMEAPPFDIIPGDTTTTMRSTLNLGGLRGFAPRDPGDVLMLCRAGQMSPRNATDVPIAVSVPKDRALPYGGRLIIATFPLKGAVSSQYVGVPRLLAKIFKQLGLAD